MEDFLNENDEISNQHELQLGKIDFEKQENEELKEEGLITTNSQNDGEGISERIPVFQKYSENLLLTEDIIQEEPIFEEMEKDLDNENN